MIATTGAAPLADYAAYVYNCLRNLSCEPSWAAPLPGVPYLQLYVDFGPYKPVTYELWLQDMCDLSHTEQLFASNYIVGKTPEGNWYGVFKYITHPLVPVSNFVAWLSVLVDAPGGLREQTYFSELLQVELCLPLTKIKACYPAGSTDTGFDLLGVYYGLPVTSDFLGFEGIRYFHIAYTRLTKARELPAKVTFTSNLIRTFRSSVDRTWSLQTELVPKWYYEELLAIYARGALSLDNGSTYLVSDVNAEGINDDDLTWKPFATLRQTTRLFFGCDTSVCVECCSPRVLSATSTFCCSPSVLSATVDVVADSSSGSQSDSGSSSSSASESGSSSASDSGSSSIGFDEDAIAFIIAAGIDNPPIEEAINDLVVGLKVAGVWSKLVAIYPMAEAFVASHKLNLKDPRDLDAAFRLTFPNGATHSGAGIDWNGIDQYADTHLSPTVTLNINDVSAGYYTDTVALNTDKVELGCLDGGQVLQLLVSYFTTAYWQLTGTLVTTAIVSNTGLTSGTNKAGTLDLYRNGASIASAADTTTTLPATTIFLNARDDNGLPFAFSSKRCSFAFIGQGLTSTESLNLYNLIQSYQAALGRDV